MAAQLRANGLPVSSPEVFLPGKAETQLLFALLRFIALRDNHTKAELAKFVLNKSLPEIISHKDEILTKFDYMRLDEILERIKYQSVPDIVDTIIDEMDLRGLCAKWGDAPNRRIWIRCRRRPESMTTTVSSWVLVPPSAAILTM